MKSGRSYIINISSLLIIVGSLQLLWPGYLWLGLYRALAVIGLFLVLFSTAMIFYASKHGRFANKGDLKKQKFKPSVALLNTIILLLAWMLKDPWAWWLTLALIVAGWSSRWILRKHVKSVKPPT